MAKQTMQDLIRVFLGNSLVNECIVCHYPVKTIYLLIFENDIYIFHNVCDVKISEVSMVLQQVIDF